MSPRSQNAIPFPDKVVAILAVSPSADDHASLRRILSHPNWQLHESRDRKQALGFLKEHQTALVLCERDQADGTWRDVLDGLPELRMPPSLIVFSRLADDRLWSEVLNLGGYDVLVKSFAEEEVLRVLSAAWRSWKRGSPAKAPPAAAAEPGNFTWSRRERLSCRLNDG